MAINDIATALANEARRQELKQKISTLKGTVQTTALLMGRISTLNSDANQELTLYNQELTALEQGAGPGVTDDFGQKSIVTQLIEKERFAAKAASIDFVKENTSCTEEDVATSWNEAALASHPDFPFVIQDALVMGKLYRANLLAANIIDEDTWEAQRAWIIATPKDIIMGA